MTLKVVGGIHYEAARLWLRLAETDTANLELTERVVWSMVFGGNTRKAEPLIVRASDAHPESLTLLRLRWRVAFDNKNWPLSISTGETLLRSDSAAKTDSLFFLRLSLFRTNAGPPAMAIPKPVPEQKKWQGLFTH